MSSKEFPAGASAQDLSGWLWDGKHPGSASFEVGCKTGALEH